MPPVALTWAAWGNDSRMGGRVEMRRWVVDLSALTAEQSQAIQLPQRLRYRWREQACRAHSAIN